MDAWVVSTLLSIMLKSTLMDNSLGGHIFDFSCVETRSGISGSDSKLLFSFFRLFPKPFPKLVAPFYTPTSISLHPGQCLSLSVFLMTITVLCVAVSDCDSDLPF